MSVQNVKKAKIIQCTLIKYYFISYILEVISLSKVKIIIYLPPSSGLVLCSYVYKVVEIHENSNKRRSNGLAH
jgi:hypothetical protein